MRTALERVLPRRASLSAAAWEFCSITLRSVGGNLLTVPPSRMRSYGDRRFAHAAPTLWNSLPLNVRNADSLNAFKRMLKTHLFSGAM